MNNLFQSNPDYSKGSYRTNKKNFKQHTDTLGGTHKANKIVRNNQMMEAIEDCFMNIAFKSNRSEAQRELRRSKRG